MQKLYERLFSRPVFRLQDVPALVPEWTAATARQRLKDLARQGRVGRIAFGVYFLVPPGKTPETTSVDPYVVGAHLAPDALLAYHTALELLGTAASATRVVYYISRTYRPPLVWRDIQFRQVKPARSLARVGETRIAVATQERDGLPVTHTNRERTLVDCVDRLDLAGGLEELLRSVEAWPAVDARMVLRYLNTLGKVTLFPKVGYILERFARPWGLSESDLAPLRARVPRSAVYLADRHKPSRYVAQWRLMVPSLFVQRAT